MAEASPFQFTKFNYSTLPQPGRKTAGPPAVTVRANGQLAFNAAASKLFHPKAEYACIHTAAIPKGGKPPATKPPAFAIQGLIAPDPEDISPSLCRGTKSKNVTLSLKTYLREVMKWDSATIGNVTLPVALHGELIVIALPATPPPPNKVVPRARKPKADVATKATATTAVAPPAEVEF